MPSKLSKETFIEKAKKIHGNKYDYSKVEYINNHTKVCIICPEHGEFWQIPNNHLNGKGCKYCSINKVSKKRLSTTNDFIKKAKCVHGDKYDYSKVNYVNAKTKVCIICHEHGEFWQTPDAHLNNQGCPYCSLTKHGSTHTFIEKAKKIHGDKYNYSKVEYKNSKTKVCIICPEHGEFWQRPSEHLKGNGCKKCANYNLWKEKRKKIDFIEFKQRVIEKFGNIYDFSKTKYVDAHTKIIIGYNGKFFEIVPAKLMSNSQKKPIKHDFIENTEDFIKKSKSIYGDKYDYSKVSYVKSREKVCIICKKHGEFFQSPNDHINGCQCPKCVNSNLENELKIFFIKNNIEFMEQYSPSFLNERFSHQKYDFFLPKFNIAIECQGKQHFYPVEIFGGKIALNENKNRDRKKSIKSDLNEIKILYYIDSHIKLSEILNNNEYNFIYTEENTFKNKKKLLNKIFSFK